MDADAQIAVVRHIFAIAAPAALPEPEPGYTLTRLAVLPVHALNEDVFFPLDKLRPAIEQWLEQGYRRQRLYTLAAPEADSAGEEVYSQWDDVLCRWGQWTVAPFGAPVPHVWTIEETLRREG